MKDRRVKDRMSDRFVFCFLYHPQSVYFKQYFVDYWFCKVKAERKRPFLILEALVFFVNRELILSIPT